MTDAPVKAINININPASELELQNALETVFGAPAATMPPRATDEYGTPVEAFQMPDTFDANEANYSFNTQISAMSMLAMRMRWGYFSSVEMRLSTGMSIPFDHLTIHRAKHKVFIMLVNNGTPVTLEDEPELFPSDALVAKLIMLAPGEKA